MHENTATGMIPDDAFETDDTHGTLGAEEELWLSDPATFKLAGGAQEILESEPDDLFSGELIDCEIESNSGVHPDASGVAGDLISRRGVLLGHAERMGRLLGTSGTHPIGDWRAQEIIEKPHYKRLEKKLGWLIRRNNTFSLHVHYAVSGRERAIYVMDRIREYVPHMLALSVNSPFWQGEYTDMHSSRVLIFARSIHRAGMPEPMGSWDEYVRYVDFVSRSEMIHAMGEIWWDVRPHPGLGTIEIRAFDAQTDATRNEGLISLTAGLCDMISSEFDSGDLRPVRPSREIEENKWLAQRYGMDATFTDHETHEKSPAREVMHELLDMVRSGTDRDMTSVERLIDAPTESERQLEVYRESGSLEQVVQDIARRTIPAG